MTTKPWILFDIGGVFALADDGHWQPRFSARLRERAGLDAETFGARIDAADLPRIDIEQGGEAEYWRRVGDALGFDAAIRADVRTEFWNAYCGSANSELLAYARSLPAHVGRAALSNSADGAREEEERRFDLSSVVDPIFYSHEIGVAKPNAAAYAAALSLMNARPDDVLFIDDHRVSLDGAAAVGIRGHLHTDNATTIEAIEEFLEPYAL
ncbi:HAD-IA family hydrolase [Microbacterium horticulturae]|uniref:HAD-IA family hydrolase n=1 Tax=Microbacterium horticulturae TaxID=3028316 RepID=A0ABY8C5Z4_9MICO|nr:HAD-IA family hydrolase [Microbacterium sp. KACC 23027]WEG10243.1 HAD-IA family hydrolase [Microbacterium sp. KACC 23027]